MHQLAGRWQGEDVNISSPTLLADVAGDGGDHRRAEVGVPDRLLHDVSHRDEVAVTRRRSRRRRTGYGHGAAGRIALRRRWQHGDGEGQPRRGVASGAESGGGSSSACRIP